MINQSQYTKSENLLDVGQKQRHQASKLLKLVDGVIHRSLKNKDPLEKFLFDLRRYCIANEIKEMSATFQNESELILLTEEIKLEPGALIVVDSRLGWNINFNDVYYIEEVIDNGYLVRDNGDGKAWKYTQAKLWKILFARQENGANAYLILPNHPEYWTAKVRLGLMPPHQKKEISWIVIQPRKVIREMVDWRDMLSTQDHLKFHNGQQSLIPVALEGYIDKMPIDEIENTDFLRKSDREYSKIFNQTTLVFKTAQGQIIRMSYDELINQKWVQIEMGY